MNKEFEPLVGQTISSVEKLDHSWIFTMSGGDSVVSEAPWRLVSDDGIIAASEDHEHQFGLPAPVDAAAQIVEEIGTAEIVSVIYESKTGDLAIKMNNRKEIHFLQLSTGYEAWRLRVRGHEIICLGGGECASFTRNE